MNTINDAVKKVYPDKDVKFIKVTAQGIGVYFTDYTMMNLTAPEKEIWIDFEDFDKRI